MSDLRPERASVEVDGDPASYLTIPVAGPVVLLLHGTYWSRVWLPVLRDMAYAGIRPIAVDLRGLGLSAGEIDLATGSVPALAAWVERFLGALDIDGPIAVAGHDIGGAIAQRLLVRSELDVTHLVLANSVTFDSWPVPGVARYRDSAVVDAATEAEILTSRRVAIAAALAGAANERLVEEYLEPWRRANVRRSWMRLAGAAHHRYTEELVPELQQSSTPKLLVWGEDDTFQRISYAERFVAEIPRSTLVRVPRAGHIPMENDPTTIARAISDFILSS